MDQDLTSRAAARRAAETAFAAYQEFLGADPAVIDALVDAMARAIEPEAKRLAEIAVDETGYGNVADKRVKNLFNALSVADYLRDVTTLGLLWRDDATKIAAIGEPMGVVAALIPVTNPTSTIIYKVLSAVKAGNAIVTAPHPRGVRSGVETVRVMAEAAERLGAPKGLIQCLDQVTLDGTAELMRHRRTSIVMATGGPGMVKTAYSSGKPTLAVGAGNVPCYVHASMAGQLDEVAEQIITSKAFDYGTACVSEQAVIADRAIARDLRHEMRMRGAYFCTSAEADRLASTIFTDGGTINPEMVGQSPSSLAEAAGFAVTPKTRCLVAEETEIGWQAPLSAEKLNPVLAFYEAGDEAKGIDLAMRIAKFGGWGHTSVIHAEDPKIVARYSAIPTGRVLVNTPAIIGGMGYSTDLE
ncbi:MAG: aldehyde dehydrogenase family protein, partial [Geminicoccaceae bacterium]